MTWQVEPATDAHLSSWAALRAMLWLDESIAQHRAEIVAQLAHGRDLIAHVATVDGTVVGFAEASLRRDHVNGCDTSPVAFLEGITVDPAWRGQGIARALVAAIENWGRARGCSELGSDADEENADGRALHRRLGFEERERVVFFRKLL